MMVDSLEAQGKPASLLECVRGRSGDIFTLLPDKKNTLNVIVCRTINRGRKKSSFTSVNKIFVGSSTEVDLVETLPTEGLALE